MIKINLLTVERKAAAKKKFAIGDGQKITIACSVLLIATALFVGWRYWTLTRESAQLDADLSASQLETTRLHSIIQQVQEFEQRKAQLQQRVVLIEQLRKSQIGPVHMLDEISRALPPMLWLTELKQDAAGEAVVIDGRTTVQTGVSDFVANLEASGYFKKSIDILGTRTVPMTQPPGELVTFSLRAKFLTPGEAKAAASTAAPALKR